MKFIELTQGKRVMVDDEDFEWLNQWKWHVLRIPRKFGDRFYALRTSYPLLKKIYMHRQIYYQHYSHPPPQ